MASDRRWLATLDRDGRLRQAAAAPRSPFLAGVAVALVALAVDIALPAEFAVGALYVFATLLAFWLPSRRPVLALAAVATACAVVGYVASPASPAFGTPETIVNRALAIGVIWCAAGLALMHRASRSSLDRSGADLKDQQARLLSILDTAPEAFVTIHQNGQIESFSRSAEQLFGYAADEVVGRNVSMLMPSPHAARHDGYIERYLRTGERRIIGIGRTVEGRRKEGSVFPMELAVGEAHVNEHRIFTGFIRDLTARRKMELELRQSQKMEAIGQLTGGIAHDFNNLLTVILGNLEMLRSRLREPEQIELLAEAQDAAGLGARLTESLLAFGRRQPLNPRRTDVGRLVAEFSELIRRTLGEAVVVSTGVVGEPQEAFVDASQLQNALLNLAINARDAMPGGGRLDIEVSAAVIGADDAPLYPGVRVGRYVAIAVTDSGVGMSREVQERAFEPFFTTKPVGSGTGLGLSMVYGFVKQSGGHVGIYSEPGQGTTVRICLPAALEAEDSATTPDEAPDPGARGETILVVEDDPRVRRVTVARLKELGYEVVEADGGPAALDLLDAKPAVDLLFTDVVMPGGLTGFDLVELARTKRPDLKVLFTSGYAAPDTIRQGRGETGHWLRKPYARADLARKLRDVLDYPDAPPAASGECRSTFSANT